jgi:23S rRNA pseudouridine2605 synthase
MRNAKTPPADAGGFILMFHKPRGVVVTRNDECGRRTVYDLLPPWVRGDGWKAVGRLDLDSRGLLLFVKSGKLQEALARPGSHDKVYEVWVRGRVTPEHVKAMLAGVSTPKGRLRAIAVQLKGGAGPKSRAVVTLDEGKNRHLRRMFEALTDPKTGTSLKVLELKRVSFGRVELDIPSGTWRWLTDEECAALV